MTERNTKGSGRLTELCDFLAQDMEMDGAQKSRFDGHGTEANDRRFAELEQHCRVQAPACAVALKEYDCTATMTTHVGFVGSLSSLALCMQSENKESGRGQLARAFHSKSKNNSSATNRQLCCSQGTFGPFRSC